jgi:APA family basic amino acid/polyamine antiporter
MPTADPASQPALVRGLTLTHAICLVVGTVIGAGVFLKAAVMAQDVGSPLLVLAAWTLAGLLSLAGALTYAELAALMPHAGGEYVFLREAYGRAPAFLFGWMRMAVAATGAIAGLAVGLATFLSALVPLDAVWAERTFQLLGQTVTWQFGMRQAVAVGVILLLSAINCAGVSMSGHVQTFMTGLKVLGIGLVVGGVFLFSGEARWDNLAAPSGGGEWAGFAAFGSAMLAALWGYDGWNQMPMVAGEVHRPERNVARALVGGMAAIILIYCLTNLAYFYALPFQEVVTANSTLHRDAPPVAAKAAETFLGGLGGRLVAVVFVLSALGALNGCILMSSRVPYAMARDGLFFSRLAQVSDTTRVPVLSIAVQAVWASLLALSGTFDQLTDCVVFASWLFYALVASSVFVLRRKLRHVARPYRTPGYPFVPAVFVLVAVWLVLNTMQTRPVESAAGLALIAAGLPLYAYLFGRRARRVGVAGALDMEPRIDTNGHEYTRISKGDGD